MSQPDRPRSAFKAFFDTAKTDYAQKAAGMAERAGEAVLNTATLDQATNLLLGVKKVATLAQGTDGLVDDIHQKITAKGLPIPSDRTLLAFVPDTSKQEPETESSPPHPIKQIFGVIESETREEASALANSASTYFKNGEFDMGMAEADRSIEVAKKSTEINTVAEEIVALVNERGYEDLSPGILERTAIMMYGEQYRKQSNLTTPSIPLAAAEPTPFLTGDLEILNVSAPETPTQPVEATALAAEPQVTPVTPIVEITTPSPDPETNTTVDQGVKETKIDEKLLEIRLTGNELTLGARKINLTDEEKTILLRIPLKGEGMIKSVDAAAGLFEGFESKNKFDRTMRSIEAKLAFVTKGQASMHSKPGIKGGRSLDGAVIKVIEPDTSDEAKNPDTRPVAGWINPLLTPLAPAELGPEQIATPPALTTEESRQPEPTSPVQLTIEGEYLVHGDKKLKLNPAEIAILERLPDIKDGYKRGPEIGEGLFPGLVFKNKFKKVYNALRKKLDDLTGRDLIKTQKGMGGGLALEGAVIVRSETKHETAVQPQEEQTKAEPAAVIETQTTVATPEPTTIPVELPAAVIEAALPSQKILPTESVKNSTETAEKTENGERAKTDISVKDEAIVRSLLIFNEKTDRFEQATVKTAAAEVYQAELAEIADEAARRDQEITYAVQINSKLKTLAALIVEGRNSRKSGDITDSENLAALAKWVDSLTYQKTPLYIDFGVKGLYETMSRGYSFDVVKEMSRGVSKKNKGFRKGRR